ncbi:hypothetical protein, partial [Rikenella microfusus]|uniref:hypothetical protein n=1 Tax=Rikenella microfusus TaxID=28139 RepID=UPI00266FA5E3
ETDAPRHERERKNKRLSAKDTRLNLLLICRFKAGASENKGGYIPVRVPSNTSPAPGVAPGWLRENIAINRTAIFRSGRAFK